MKLIAENIRSLGGKHEVPLARLTLLVGENSSGKSTCLAALSAIFSTAGFPARPPFNEPPFDLGGYETIATYRGGRYGRAKHFSLGYKFESPTDRLDAEVIGVYKNSAGQPVLSSVSARSKTVGMNLAFEGNHVNGKIIFPASQDSPAVEIPIDNDVPEIAFTAPYSLAYVLFTLVGRRELSPNHTRALLTLAEQPSMFRTVAVAPVRTKPRRTYDPITDEFQPEGDHIPLVLARLLSSGTPSKQREDLRSALVGFGESSGLFTEVKIRKLGQSASDPFQILVASDARPFNLTDVGYGVSQALPVVVESTRSSKDQMLLLQQPEVHLHPRAQAALGSFFATLVAAEGKQLVVETHSDYLIDRVRQEVAKGTLSPDLVSVLFFEQRHGETIIHRLQIDPQGNIVDAPPTYRSFFLEEEQALLRRTEPTLFD